MSYKKEGPCLWKASNQQDTAGNGVRWAAHLGDVPSKLPKAQ